MGRICVAIARVDSVEAFVQHFSTKIAQSMIISIRSQAYLDGRFTDMKGWLQVVAEPLAVHGGYWCMTSVPILPVVIVGGGVVGCGVFVFGGIMILYPRVSLLSCAAQNVFANCQT